MKISTLFKRGAVILPVAAMAVAVGSVGLFGGTTYASTFTTNGNTGVITSDGTGLDGVNGASLVSFTGTEYEITGTMDEIRQTIVAIHDYINAAPTDPAVIAFKAKLAGATEVKLLPTDTTANVITDDLRYINFITGYVGINTADFIVDMTATNIDITSADLSLIDFKVRTVTASGKIVVIDKTQLDQLQDLINDAGGTLTAGEGIYDENGNLLVAPNTGSFSSVNTVVLSAAVLSVLAVGALAGAVFTARKLLANKS